MPKFRVQGLGVQGLGFGVWGLGCVGFKGSLKCLMYGPLGCIVYIEVPFLRAQNQGSRIYPKIGLRVEGLRVFGAKFVERSLHRLRKPSDNASGFPPAPTRGRGRACNT